MHLNKRPADYLGKRYYPEYRGAFHGEFPHIAICDRHTDTVVHRSHFSPDRFDEAWNTACQMADLLNQELAKLRRSPQREALAAAPDN